MSEEISINDVNKHYLNKVMDLAEDRDVEASEDIFDARGTKLVAKGARITRNLQERLILHKLHKPLESSITVANGINTDLVLAEAERLSDTVAPVGSMRRVVSKSGVSPLYILKQARFGSAMSLMLTITERGGESALAHSVMVSLVSICLAKKMGLDEKAQTTVALAGLLHDIGELYIEPEYLDNKRRLLPHEWRHVVVHPRIGQMLIQELEKFPPEVALAVSEHHERFDGAGYPRQLTGKNISIPGQIVSVAEMISGVFMRQDRPLERAALALKIIPGEHAHELVSAVSSVLQITRGEQENILESSGVENVVAKAQTLFATINAVLERGRELLESPHLQSKAGKNLLLQCMQQALVVKRAFNSTGLDVCMLEGSDGLATQCMEIQFEVAVASKEIQWRLRDVARNLALHCVGLSADEAAALQPLIVLLDQGL